MSDDIAFEAEIQALENDIATTMPQHAKVENHIIPVPPKQPKQKETRGRKPIKNDLMDKITKLEAALGYDISETADLKKLSVAKLEEKLADLTTHGLAKKYDLIDDPDESSSDEEEYEIADQDHPRTKFSNRKRADPYVNAMFQFNLNIARFMELTAKNFENEIGTNLDGYSAKLQSPEIRPELEAVLQEIYEENMDQIQDFMTPLNRYSMIMLGTAATQMTNNKYVK